METINIRRSIRSFTDKKVESEKIEKLLRAAMQAPSAGNQQPWEFVVVQNEEVKEKLSTISPYAKPIKNAPLAIVLVEKTTGLNFPENSTQDMGACAQNILLEVVELGLGAVWLGVKPDEARMDIVSKTLNLPENISPFAVIAVGYSDAENKFVDRFDETRIHNDTY